MTKSKSSIDPPSTGNGPRGLEDQAAAVKVAVASVPRGSAEEGEDEENQQQAAASSTGRRTKVTGPTYKDQMRDAATAARQDGSSLFPPLADALLVTESRISIEERERLAQQCLELRAEVDRQRIALEREEQDKKRRRLVRIGAAVAATVLLVLVATAVAGVYCFGGGNRCGTGGGGDSVAPAASGLGGGDSVAPATTTCDANGSDDLCSGESLLVSQRLTSRNRFYHVDMQPDGNFVLYRQCNGGVPDTTRIALWATTTSEADLAYMQEDGNLVVYRDTTFTMPLWASRTHGQPGNWLRLLDDGDLVMYGESGDRRWATFTYNNGGCP
jgi:hypothetical protein